MGFLLVEMGVRFPVSQICVLGTRLCMCFWMTEAAGMGESERFLCEAKDGF